MRERNQVQEVEDWRLVSINMNTLNIYQGEKIVFVSGNAEFFWNFGMYIQVTCLLDLEWIVRDHNEELGLYVGGIAPCILHCSFYMILHYENHTRISTTGTMEIGEGIMLHSNKTSSCG